MFENNQKIYEHFSFLKVQNVSEGFPKNYKNAKVFKNLLKTFSNISKVFLWFANTFQTL